MLCICLTVGEMAGESELLTLDCDIFKDSALRGKGYQAKPNGVKSENDIQNYYPLILSKVPPFLKEI